MNLAIVNRMTIHRYNNEPIGKKITLNQMVAANPQLSFCKISNNQTINVTCYTGVGGGV